MSIPSEHFENAFRGGGGIRAECDFCGRVHFTTLPFAGDWEEGEFESLIERAENNPDQYIAEGRYDSITYGTLAGRTYVLDCPCVEEKVLPYENFIWNYRHQILSYHQMRTKSERDEAERNHEEVSDQYKPWCAPTTRQQEINRARSRMLS